MFRHRAAEMNQQKKSRCCGLGILAAERNDRAPGSVWIVIDALDIFFLEWSKLDFFAYVFAFWNPAVFFDPCDDFISDGLELLLFYYGFLLWWRISDYHFILRDPATTELR